MKNNEQGRSMIEMLGVLSIVGILSMSGISLYTKALYRRKISNTIDQVTEIMTNTRNACRNRRSYDCIPKNLYKCYGKEDETIESCDKRGLIPENMWLADGQTIRSDIGSIVNMSKVDGEKKFTLSLKDGDMNKYACIRIATSDLGKNVWVEVEKESNDGHLSIAQANKVCKSSNNTIVWTVK